MSVDDKMTELKELLSEKLNSIINELEDLNEGIKKVYDIIEDRIVLHKD